MSLLKTDKETFPNLAPAPAFSQKAGQGWAESLALGPS